MTDYTELVKALLHCVSDEKGVTKCAGCPYYPDITGCMDRLHTDAAAAIEKLVTLYEKAEIDATNLTGKLAQAEAQLPKRGEWIKRHEFVEDMRFDGFRCQDYLNEYGRCEMDEVDKDIEVLYWMPLPSPPVNEKFTK